MSQENRDKVDEMSKETANSAEVDPKQVPPQAGSSTPATAPTQSRLGRLTSALISKLLVPKEFENLISSGAISINNEKLPIHLLPTDGSDDQSGYALSSVLGKLIASNPGLSGDLVDYTISDLQNAVEQATEKRYQDPSTSHFTQPPTKFGTDVICEEDIARLSQLRKLDNNRENVVRILDSCSMFHTLSGSKFSKPEFLRLVKLSLPNRAHETCDAVCTSSNNDPIEVYRILSLRFDNRKSKDQVLHELQRLQSADLSIIEAFERIYDLVINLRDKSVSIDQRCYEEGMRLLRARVNPTTFATIRTLLREHKNPESFYTLYSVCKDYFGQDPSLIYRPSVLNGQPIQGVQLTPPQQVAQVHPTGTNANPDKQSPNQQNEIDSLRQDLKADIKNIRNDMLNAVNAISKKGKSQTGGAKAKNKKNKANKSTAGQNQSQNNNCFGCGLEGHWLANCPQRSNNKNPNYAQSNCVIHPNGKHTNMACLAQRSPCQFSASHQTHMAGDCKRPVNAKPNNQANVMPMGLQPMVPQPGGIQHVMAYPFAPMNQFAVPQNVQYMQGLSRTLAQDGQVHQMAPQPAITHHQLPMLQQASEPVKQQPTGSDVDRLRERMMRAMNDGQ